MKPGPAPPSGPVAIFDLDRTLHNGSGLSELAKVAFRRRLIGPGRMLQASLNDLAFRRRGSTDGQILSVAGLALELAAGTPVEQLDDMAGECAERISASLRPWMRSRLAGHLARDHYCVLLSASPHPLVERVADHLGIHCGIGTVIEHTDGVLTGRIEEPLCYGSGKLARLAAAVGWPSDTLADTLATTDSYAYADSISDLPVLESVRFPAAVTPDRALRRVATERGWTIIDR